MAISYLAANILQGLSSDTKPTNVPAGSRFYETDTFDDYKFDGANWALMTGCFNPNAAETLTNKNLTDSTNTFRTWVNADINASAAIAYSKLNLGTSIVNADVSTSAAIAWSKISKTGSIIGDIANVSITSPAAGDRLTYDGTNWINGKIPPTPWWFSGPTAASSLYTNAFYPFGINLRTGTEATTQMTFPYNIILKRLQAKFSTNGLNGATTVAFRDDGATATSISVGAGVTTEIDSGAISVTVASGSKINWNLDTSTSSSGTWLPEYIVAWGIVY
jgi:hypothetical protein